MKMNTIESPQSRFQLPKLAAVALGGLLLVGCAGNPPNEQFAVTESAVRSAMSAGATQVCSGRHACSPGEVEAGRARNAERKL